MLLGKNLGAFLDFRISLFSFVVVGLVFFRSLIQSYSATLYAVFACIRLGLAVFSSRLFFFRFVFLLHSSIW